MFQVQQRQKFYFHIAIAAFEDFEARTLPTLAASMQVVVAAIKNFKPTAALAAPSASATAQSDGK